MLWKSIKNKVDLHEIHDSIASLLTKIDEQWPIFLQHSYFNREQRAFINEIRLKLNGQSFAENYTFVRQREVQAAHWNNSQAIVFTVHLKVVQTRKNMVIINDHMHHDMAIVYCAESLIVEFVKKNFPQVQKINYVR